jgi:hypothetical protein
MRRAVALAALALSTLLGSPVAAEPPEWRFRQRDRPVKVMVLGGSVGAWPGESYGKLIERRCPAVEVQNIAKVGMGSAQLKARFREQVLENPHVRLRDGHEYWLLFHGGMNSVSMPEKTSSDLRDIFLLAHRRGVFVVAFSLTPWGSEKDRRFRGARGLRIMRSTRHVVDFVLGRLDPQTALGRHVARRDEPSAPWDPVERPDVAVDLWESELRDVAAPVRDLEAQREAIAADPIWQRDAAALSPEERSARLDRDAREAAEIPRLFMRPDLHAFDHIHPNDAGHRIMFDTACPVLPATWRCDC